MSKENPTVYLDESFIAPKVATGRHRDLVGGYYWRVIPLQTNPSHRYFIEKNLGVLEFAQLPLPRYLWVFVLASG